MKLEIVCAGIGGRGVLLASTILIETAINAGHHALASDEYGMSQRGGSVVSLVKIGDFKSPLIGKENADILLAFEESEFYRNLGFLKRGGLTIVNTGKDRLPAEVDAMLLKRNITYLSVNADDIAAEKNMLQASNMALLGFFSCLAVEPYSAQSIKETIRKRTKGKFLEKNMEIFDSGYAIAQDRNIREH
ncbi:MAG: 2-oxoacid:acceptor oxidoreductase family protein [Proteobacteria bacterium]|nr:2-oxoacid:acceptor oxidoreductase family protein [Pseudomonadota bacterium]